MEIQLPLPPAELHAHNKGHWTRKAKAVREYRQYAKLAAMQAMAKAGIQTGQWKQAIVLYHFFVPDLRRRDTANLIQACKPVIDGVVDAGLIPDDDWQHLGLAGASVSVDREEPRVLLLFTKMQF